MTVELQIDPGNDRRPPQVVAKLLQKEPILAPLKKLPEDRWRMSLDDEIQQFRKKQTSGTAQSRQAFSISESKGNFIARAMEYQFPEAFLD
ncbi:hypothetical protein [Rhizobium bangladeshense]|uniref:hypothetical protein n=1 Tax=Rhizobium bangladeshense TaxID=1138189 RepID=UPI001FEF37D1|nr:hypothetical protein [Rhizobium bangladeshense]